MTRIAWVEEAEIDCEPGAELCNGCDVRIKDSVCERFDDLVYHTEDPREDSRRCPACLRAEKRAVARARLGKPRIDDFELAIVGLVWGFAGIIDTAFMDAEEQAT